MKITIVMGFFLPMPPAAGGATEKSWHRLAIEFARRGHAVTVISRCWKDWPATETRDGVRHLRLRGHDHTASLRRNLWLDFRWSLRVHRALPDADVTIVNCIALPVLLGWSRRCAGRIAVMSGRSPKGQYRFYRKLDRVLAVSSPVRDAVLRENPRFADRTTIIGYPIDCQRLAATRFANTSATRPPDEPLTIGFIGRIHREKGLDLLAAALRELAHNVPQRNWRVVLCGPSEIAQGGSGGGYVSELSRTMASTLPTGRFELREPTFDDEELATLYRSIDIFCYPSIAAQGETFGVAVAEAMAAGAVPVVSNLACFRDFIRAGENGEIFDHTAPDATLQLAGILGSLLDDAPRREQLSQAARTTAHAYDFPAFAERLLADFSTLK